MRPTTSMRSPKAPEHSKPTLTLRNTDRISPDRTVMPRGIASALTVVRVARGQPPPSEAELRTALERDRLSQRLPPEPYRRDFRVAGPYEITVEGRELDEYVVWEE